MMIKILSTKKMIQIFSEIQDQTVLYLSNFAEIVHSSDYVAEKAGVAQVSGWVIKDVEIFAAGTWKGVPYTEADLDHMVQHFYDLKESGKLDPVFKVNHSEDARDQVGWILEVRKEGTLLLADIHVTEWEAYDKIQSGTWKKVSAEIYLPDLALAEFGINDYVLRAVAVVSIPAVKDIKGIVLNSERWDQDPDQPKGGGKRVEKFLLLLSELGITDVKSMTDEQKTQLEAKMKENGVELFGEFVPAPAPAAAAATPPAPAAAPAAGQAFTITADQIVALSEKISGLEKGSTDLAGQVQALTKESKKAGLEKWFVSLSEQGKVVPAEKEQIMVFAEQLEGAALEAYQKTFESRVKVVQLGEVGSQQPGSDETEATFAAFNEEFGQKKY